LLHPSCVYSPLNYIATSALFWEPEGLMNKRAVGKDRETLPMSHQTNRLESSGEQRRPPSIPRARCLSLHPPRSLPFKLFPGFFLFCAFTQVTYHGVTCLLTRAFASCNLSVIIEPWAFAGLRERRRGHLRRAPHIPRLRSHTCRWMRTRLIVRMCPPGPAG